jgi:hypothetical protein
MAVDGMEHPAAVLSVLQGEEHAVFVGVNYTLISARTHVIRLHHGCGTQGFFASPAIVAAIAQHHFLPRFNRHPDNCIITPYYNCV